MIVVERLQIDHRVEFYLDNVSFHFLIIPTPVWLLLGTAHGPCHSQKEVSIARHYKKLLETIFLESTFP